ncbi:MAG TPA: hypothetical protein VFZ40_04005 [Pyrinomonadaceae bacterium]
MTSDERRLLRHFLAALAYRTQKALRDAPAEFAEFSPGNHARTPKELVRHMTSVLGYARTYFVGGQYRPAPLPSIGAEIARFHEMVESLAGHIGTDDPIADQTTAEGLLQGPLSDAMTHAGQLAMLRRIAGNPVAPENFIVADIDSQRLGIDQAAPVSPDKEWPEAPAGWDTKTAG